MALTFDHQGVPIDVRGFNVTTQQYTDGHFNYIMNACLRVFMDLVDTDVVLAILRSR